MSSNDNDSNNSDLSEKLKFDDNDNNLKSYSLDDNEIKKDFANIKRSSSEINQKIKKNIIEI